MDSKFIQETTPQEKQLLPGYTALLPLKASLDKNTFVSLKYREGMSASAFLSFLPFCLG